MHLKVLGPGALPPGFQAGPALGLKTNTAPPEVLFRAIFAALNDGNRGEALQLIGANLAAAQTLRGFPQLASVHPELDAIVTARAAIETAVAGGDRAGALRAVAQLLAANPAAAQALRSDPQLAPIRAEITAILERVAPPPPPTIGAVIAALSAGDLTDAVRLATQLIAVNPDAIHVLRSEPLAAPIRAELETIADRTAGVPRDVVAPRLENIAEPGIQQLLTRVDQGIQPSARAAEALAAAHLTEQARSSAEVSIAGAARAVESGDVLRPDVAVSPQAAFSLANQLYDTGQYLNYLRAAELGRIIVSWRDVRATTPGALAKPRTFQAISVLWRRAPMLVLLAGWFLIGLAGGGLTWISRATGGGFDFPFEFWGLGFLVLVGFQFYATIRRPRI